MSWQLIEPASKLPRGKAIVIGWRESDLWYHRLLVIAHDFEGQEVDALIRNGITHWAMYPEWITKGPLQ